MRRTHTASLRAVLDAPARAACVGVVVVTALLGAVGALFVHTWTPADPWSAAGDGLGPSSCRPVAPRPSSA